MNVNDTAMEERGGLSASASNNDDQTQNQVNQAQETGGIVSTDTTPDTSPKRPWTPGPWQEGRPDMASIVEGYESKYVRSQHPDYHLMDVAIASGREVGDWETVMANARLIASAPDLFEALAALEKAENWTEFEQGLKQARAAMDKALGVNGG